MTMTEALSRLLIVGAATRGIDRSPLPATIPAC